MKKKFLLALASAVALLASVLVVNTLRFTSKQIAVEPVQPLGVDEGAAAGRLAGALRFQTVSSEEAARVRGEEFEGLHRIERVVAHAREAVADPRVKINRLGAFAAEPSAVSGTDTAGFQTVRRTIRQTFPDTLVAPALVLGATDSRHYARLTTDIYRFSPMRVRREDVERIDGTNERISVKDYAACVRFYHRLIKNSAQ